MKLPRKLSFQSIRAWPPVSLADFYYWFWQSSVKAFSLTRAPNGPASVNRVPRFLAAKAIMARVICHPFMGRLVDWIFDKKIPSRGMRFATSEFIDPAAKARLFWGIYESAEYRFVQKYLRGDLDVVELGSSLGVISSEIGRILSNRGRLFCIEANPRLMELLRSNGTRNAPECRAEFINAAVCVAGQEASFFEGATHETSKTWQDGGSAKLNATKVAALTIQELRRRYQIAQFALVCDIEGAEVPIILAPSSLDGCEQLIIELHETRYKGKTWLVDELCDAISHVQHMRLIDRYDCVCYFERMSKGKI